MNNLVNDTDWLDMLNEKCKLRETEKEHKCKVRGNHENYRAYGISNYHKKRGKPTKDDHLNWRSVQIRQNMWHIL